MPYKLQAMSKPATARNIVIDYCSKKGLRPEKLKKGDWLGIIAYGVQIGQAIGFKQARDVIQSNITKVEETKEGSEGGVTEAQVIE